MRDLCSRMRNEMIAASWISIASGSRVRYAAWVVVIPLLIAVSEDVNHAIGGFVGSDEV